MASKTLEKLKKDMEQERYYCVTAIEAARERIRVHANRIQEIDEFLHAVEEERE
jgi:hypothetical protein